MERSNMIEELEKKYSAAIILSVFKEIEKSPGLPKWILQTLDRKLASKSASDVMHHNTIRLKNSEISMKSLRTIVTTVHISQFDILAKRMIQIAWYRGIHLRTLHAEMKRMVEWEMGEKTRGMILKIIFANNNFVYDSYSEEGQGGVFVRRRKSNRMSEAQCLQIAHNTFIDVKYRVTGAIEEAKKVSTPVLKWDDLV